jgi:hypothetical protein
MIKEAIERWLFAKVVRKPVCFRSGAIVAACDSCPWVEGCADMDQVGNDEKGQTND